MTDSVMQAVLRVVQKQSNVRQVKLLPETVVGRSADCHLKIASAEVSRRHCKISLRVDGVYVEDLGSSNGTYLDEVPVPVKTPTFVRPGALLVIGPAKFIVEYRPSAVIQPELGAMPPAARFSGLLSPVLGSATPVEVPVALEAQVIVESQETCALLRPQEGAASVAAFPDFAAIDAAVTAEVADTEAPPRRMRSLFGIFGRNNRASTAKSIPFLPTADVDAETAQPKEEPLSELDAVELETADSVYFDDVASAPPPAALPENAFSQIGQ